ncbi:MAG: ComF family protein [Actinomycetota bacterium]|nr:ComF family protein [Actinomycetota bacterium]
MSGLWSSLIEVIYPIRCVICKRGGGEIICSSCRDNLPLIEKPICRRCGKPTGADVNSCLDCRGRFKFEKARSLGLFEAGLKEAVYGLKYKNRRSVACFLGEMAAPILADFSDVDIATFVPLSRKKMKKRGYNQAELIASRIAEGAPLPVLSLMERTSEEMDQVSLTHKERQRNVKGVFKVIKPGAAAGKNILLIDDVFTTGATADECSKVLLKAGAAKVDLLTIARVIKAD